MPKLPDSIALRHVPSREGGDVYWLRAQVPRTCQGTLHIVAGLLHQSIPESLATIFSDPKRGAAILSQVASLLPDDGGDTGNKSQ